MYSLFDKRNFLACETMSYAQFHMKKHNYFSPIISIFFSKNIQQIFSKDIIRQTSITKPVLNNMHDRILTSATVDRKLQILFFIERSY